LLKFNHILWGVLIALSVSLVWVVWQETARQSLQAPDEAPIMAVSALPDFAAITDVQAKKQAFFDFMWPSIVQANKQVLTERAYLKGLQGKKLTARQADELAELALKYQQPRQAQQSKADWLAALLLKVDVIPPSLALAQAANESAWGTSRFAREGFNFYGQWCFSEGCGLVPVARGEGKTHEVRRFDSPADSVTAYVLNLNSLAAYQDLRTLRAHLREQGQLDGAHLAQGLLAYSERGEAYVEEIQAMIRLNALAQYDQRFLQEVEQGG
jgi:Bax protein